LIDSGGAQPGTWAENPEQQIEAILESAEKVANDIVVSAEREAERYVDEVKQSADQEAAEHARRLAEMSESLIAKAEELRRHSEELLNSIEHSEQVEHQESIQHLEPFEHREGEEAIVGTESARFESPASEPEEIAFPPQEFSAGARLLATQMAVAGSGRQDIRDRLVNDFGISDPEPLLDSIFGPG
jgi:deoxyribodipyrimidine photolyase